MLGNDYEILDEVNEGYSVLLLKRFYASLFPVIEYYDWLSYGAIDKGVNFSHREFSFTLQNDIYRRFLSYSSAAELKADLERMTPVKIDIGAVYSVEPREKKLVRPTAFVPMSKELVIDIDMTDYDDIRTCCQGGDVCDKCWKFMNVAIKVLDSALRQDFGFKHLLWVYSGRRGVHCWVCDRRARQLTAEARRAVMSYLEVVRGGENQLCKVNLGPQDANHPSIIRATDILYEFFDDLMQEQGFLDTREREAKLLGVIAKVEVSQETAAALRGQSKLETSMEKWNFISKKLEKHHTSYKHDIMYQYSYPRLDVNVSIGLNHLLKSPFCVHPKTGRVCVPIDPQRCEAFSPLTTPTLPSLINEINDYAKRNPQASARDLDYRVTSLLPHVEYFRAFVARAKIGEREVKGVAKDSLDF